VDLKIVEVVVLLVAGVFFATWQFRDLRRAKKSRANNVKQKNIKPCSAMPSLMRYLR